MISSFRNLLGTKKNRLMKYSVEININLPREEFVKKLDNPDNMKHWQRGLLSYQLLSKEPKSKGAQMKLNYQTGKRKMVLTETITKINFPEEFHAIYETKGVRNMQHNYFQEIDPNNTKWISETEFQFSNIGMRLIGLLMPGIFKKQSRKFLEDFKRFAENGTSIYNK
jgi:hypothetical protein